MKSALPGIFACTIVLLLNSCCHKRGCLDSDQIDFIQMNNFSTGETDTLLFTRFLKDDGFSAATDSFYVYNGAFEGSENRLVALNFKMDVNSDWLIFVPATNGSYKVTDFLITRAVCNRCITGNDYYSKIETYRINNNIREDNLIVVER